MMNFFNRIKEEIANGGKSKENNTKINFPNLLILALLGAVLLVTANLFSNKDKLVSTQNKENLDNNKVQVSKDSKGDDSSSTESMNKINNYSDELNNKLRNILGLIDGVGKVETMIYFEKGEEYVPATNVNNSTSETEETDTNGGKRKINQNNDGKTIVTFNDKDTTKPLITQTKAPKITGICIVAEGADDKVTELRIVEAVINLFNVPENKVQVYPMKK